MKLLLTKKSRLVATALSLSALAAAFSLVQDPDCDDPVTSTTLGVYIAQFNGMSNVGSNIAFDYTVKSNPDFSWTDNKGRPKLGGPDLSHLVLDLSAFMCLKPGKTYEDLLVSAFYNELELEHCDDADAGEPCYSIGTDPTTGVFGIKIDETGNDDTSEDDFRFVLDPSVTNYGIALGKVDLAFKGGQYDRDKANVCGPVCATPPSEPQGCTPGFWKNDGKHGWINWPTGVQSTDAIPSLFTGINHYTGTTLLQALNFPGGKDLNGARQILLRAAVAAMLNAKSSEVNYPRSEADIRSAVVAAVNGTSRAAMLALAESLDLDNNLGCPLDREPLECNSCQR